MGYILALDQGTTSSRAIVFDETLSTVSVAQEEFSQIFPSPGWVEHAPDDLWSSTLRTAQSALAKAGLEASEITAIGITNQRETTLVWDKTTGEPIHNAIVWQDRRTAPICAALKEAGHEATITKQTGLLLDPYFSGTKLKWLLDTVEGAREKAAAGEILFGTVDCFLIWKLTGGAIHATDATNAARTLLYDIHRGCWSAEICALLEIPMEMLPDVRDCDADFGSTELLGAPIPIRGVAGDQQAATIGQACFRPGMLKSTYGTGCFALLNTGAKPVASKNRMLTTIAYQLGGQPTYALEGSIFVAGAVVQWMRDRLRIIETAHETAALADNADSTENVILVPAFTGLGAPYWNSECRGAVFGLTRNTGAEEIAKAALQSVGFQTRDLLEAMQDDWGDAGETGIVRVDGGMSASNWAMQYLADILGSPVDRPKELEATARGVAWLAGQATGVMGDMESYASTWAVDRRFEPLMPADAREDAYAGWKRAVAAAQMV